MGQKVDNSILQTVLSKIDETWDEEVEFLQQLGRFPSTLGNEAGVQQFIADYFTEKLQLETDVFEPELDKISKMPGFSPVEWTYEGRPVVVGQWKTSGAKMGKSLILQGHIDVVSPEPSDRWTYDPWGSTVVGERMYGRGLQDMKSGVAAMIFAAKAIKEAGIELGSDLLLETVIEEECTGNGTLATLEKGYVADGALIPEPFGLTATVAQVGVVWIRVKVTGQAAHVERADRAVNAIEKACVLIQALEKYRDYINSLPKPETFQHHQVPLSVNVGTMESGYWPSSVPLECTFVVRVGLYPGQDPQQAKNEVEAWILQAASEDDWLKDVPPTFSYFGFHAEGVVLDKDLELLKVLESAHHHTQGEVLEQVSLTCTTDIRHYSLYYGIPATCYGPTGGNMHGIDEWVDLPSVKEVTKTYAAFILEWCGVRNQ